MKIVAVFLLLCGIAVTVHAQGNQWTWGGGVPNNPNRPPPGVFPDNPPQPGDGPQTVPGPAPAPATPGEIDRNGQLIGCPCVSTQETNLVCGTDGNTYGNMGKLRCAQRCKEGLELNHLGICQPLIPRPDPIIPEQKGIDESEVPVVYPQTS